MKISITGASGFVGTHLIDYLKVSNEMNAMHIRYMPNQQINLKGDAIIHLAGKAHDLKKTSNPQDYYEANFELTKQLFDAFIDSELNVLIFMSTVKAVADEVEGILYEHKTPNPKSHYGISKQMAEKYILSQELPREKRIYILRPCIIHGPGNKGNLNLLHKLVDKGIPWPLGSIENQRSFLCIENLCFVINELLENKTIPSGIYHVADNESLSTNELIQLLAESLRKKTKILKINVLFIKFLAYLGDRIPLPLNTERLQKLTENYVVSNEKIVKVLGKKLPISAREGLIRTFKSFTHV